MLSPEENIVNKAKESLDVDAHFNGYETSLKVLRICLIMLFFIVIIQMTMFSTIYYSSLYWIYDPMFIALMNIEFPIGAIILIIYALHLTQLIVIFRFQKRVKSILNSEEHSYKNLVWHFLGLIVLINLIPSFLSLAVSTLLLILSVSIYLKHKST